MEHDFSKLPARYHFLNTDGFSVWLTDESDTSAGDPPVMTFNLDMETPEIFNKSFLSYSSRNVVMEALKDWYYLVLTTSPHLQGERMFPTINSQIFRNKDLVILPFEQSEGVQDSRQIIFFRNISHISNSAIPWREQTISLAWEIMRFAKVVEPDFKVEGISKEILLETPNFTLNGKKNLYFHKLEIVVQ